MCRMKNKANNYDLVNINGSIESFENGETSLINNYLIATVKIHEISNDFIFQSGNFSLSYNSRHDKDGIIKSMDEA
jgi:hypothetical protein